METTANPRIVKGYQPDYDRRRECLECERLQRQDSLDEQMATVMRLAVQAGCYDAHDWLRANYSKDRL